MIELTANTYLWIKAFHIIAVIAWMAGLLYLPRLFVYHCDAKAGSQQSETFKVMERRLLRGIINPAAFFVLLLGGLLLVSMNETAWLTGWLITKLILLIVLFTLHGMMGRWYRDFSNDRNKRSSTFFRYVNEVPAILMVFIVILAVVRPF